MLWVGGASIVRDVIQFGSMLVLVRLLSPQVYGQAALGQTIFALVAITSFRSIVGFALQSRDPAAFDWDSQFSVGLVLNGGVFLLCNLIALLMHLLGNASLGKVSVVLALMSIGLLLEPLASQHHTWLHAHHRWSRMRLLELAVCLSGAVAGIGLAASGAGVYALAAMTPLQQVPMVLDAIRFKEHRHRFRRESIRRFRSATTFSVNRIASGLSSAGVGVAEQSLMTSIFGFSSLGLYTRAIGLANMTSGRIGPIAGQALYPILTRAPINSPQFRRFSGLLIASVMLTSIPAAVFLASNKYGLVRLLYGAKWFSASPLIPVGAFVVVIGGLNVIIGQILLANGQQRHTLAVEIFGGVTRLIVAFATLPLGLEVFLIGLAAQGFVVMIYGLILAQADGALDARSAIQPALPAGAAATASGLLIWALPLGQSAPLLLASILAKALLFGLTYLIGLRALSPSLILEILSALPLSARAAHRIRAILFLAPEVKQ